MTTLTRSQVEALKSDGYRFFPDASTKAPAEAKRVLIDGVVYVVGKEQ